MLNYKTYLIRERVVMYSHANTYDIYDAVTNQLVAAAVEEPPNALKLLKAMKTHRASSKSLDIRGYLRLIWNFWLTSHQVKVFDKSNGQVAFSLIRGFSWSGTRVEIVDGRGPTLGYLKSKLVSPGGGFYLYDSQDQPLAQVKGDWKGFDFKMISNDGQELGEVTKQWAGLKKELFTSTDNYVIALNDNQVDNPVGDMLLLAAGLAIDLVYHSRKSRTW
ncbi:MAG: hypothetical protein JNM18_08465 [Planctomycetaceae bacterium]|nr:hypothetical protein [Planctomycetaceae bacterium]